MNQTGLTCAPSPSASVRPIARLRGSLTVPGDKSISHRAALFNAVGHGQATITNYASGADCRSTLSCLSQLGVQIARDQAGTVTVRGAGWEGLQEPADILDCGNSGTTTRLLCGLLAGSNIFSVLSGDASLRRRPMARVVQPLARRGARFVGRSSNNLLPLAMEPSQGALKGGVERLEVASAQVKSALLLAGLRADQPLTVIEPSPSRDHTERLLNAMGASVTTHEEQGNRVTVLPAERLSCVDVSVPGDFSSAAFWLVLACLHPDATLTIRDVGLNPGRTGLLDILKEMGANLRVENARVEAGEEVGDIVAGSSSLAGVTVGGRLIPRTIDELPLVALLGLFARGETVVRDAAELRVKESDRVAAVAEGLRALGGAAVETPDGWRISPSRLRFGQVDSHGDHRLAMLFALAGVAGEGAEITGADAVSVSYPSFWKDLETISSS